MLHVFMILCIKLLHACFFAFHVFTMTNTVGIPAIRGQHSFKMSKNCGRYSSRLVFRP